MIKKYEIYSGLHHSSPVAFLTRAPVPGDDLGTIEHPAPNVEPGDVVVLDDGREALVTSRVETDGGQVTALLEVAIAPTPRCVEEPTFQRRVIRPPVFGPSPRAWETVVS
jgi:hypothetical protein